MTYFLNGLYHVSFSTTLTNFSLDNTEFFENVFIGRPKYDFPTYGYWWAKEDNRTRYIEFSDFEEGLKKLSNRVSMFVQSLESLENLDKLGNKI